MNKNAKEPTSTAHKIWTVVGIVLCVILVPILIVNCTLLIKGWTNKDEVPTVGSFAPMIVLSPSMEGDAKDCFHEGDLIFIKTAQPEDISVGQVITFYDPDGTGTSVLSHRVVEIFEKDGKTYYRTKGDNNNANDPTPAPAENLIGTYTGVRIPFAGYVAIQMQKPWGLALCILVPIAIFVGYDAIRRAKYNKAHARDKEELLAELEELRRLKEAAPETPAEPTAPPAPEPSEAE